MTISPRFFSVDILRGLAIAIMLLGNMTPDFTYCYAQLQHAGWQDVHLLDLAFPSFMFIMGTSAAFSRRLFTSTGCLQYSHWLVPILRRGCLLFLLGLLCNNLGNIAAFCFLPEFQAADLINSVISHGRLWGVLQRLGICYISGLLLIRYLPETRHLLLLCMLLLFSSSLGYHLYAPMSPFAEASNISAAIDSIFIGTSHNYLQGPYDPEGLYGTMNATVTFLLGFLTGRRLKTASHALAPLLIGGLLCLCLAYAWSHFDMVGKPLWTSPYTLYMAGIDIILLVCIQYCSTHSKAFTNMLHPCSILGKNPILIYLLSEAILAFCWTIPYNNQPLYTFLWQATCYSDLNLQFSCAIYSFIWLGLLATLCALLASKNIILKI